MKKFVYLLAGAILGGITGSVLVFLFTPASGDEIRYQIKEAFSKLTEEVRSAAEQRRVELNEQLAKLRSSVPGG